MDTRHEKILGRGFDQNFNPNCWSVRVNTLKVPVDDFKKKFEGRGYTLEKIPWTGEGFWIRTEDVLTQTREHSLGHFFSQNSSSMIPPVVLDPKKEDRVLDLAASPGAKTTQISAMMGNSGVIVANDVDAKRLLALKSNLQRCGAINVAVTKIRGEYFWKKGIKFDKVLLDVPCTGTGTMKPGVFESAGESTIKKMSKKQKMLLTSAARSLKEDGKIVYSTCSLEPEENESVIDFGIRELGLKTEKIGLEIPKEKLGNVITSWGKENFNDEVKNAVRVLPSENTEGFFICKLRA